MGRFLFNPNPYIHCFTSIGEITDVEVNSKDSKGVLKGVFISNTFPNKESHKKRHTRIDSWSLIDMIFSLRLLLEKFRKGNRSMKYYLFSFVMVSSSGILKLLRNIGCHPKLQKCKRKSNVQWNFIKPDLNLLTSTAASNMCAWTFSVWHIFLLPTALCF